MPTALPPSVPPLDDLPDGQLAALRAIVEARRAWSPAASLDPSALAALVSLGLAELWDDGPIPDGGDDVGGPAATLTPLAAERLGVVLVEVGAAEEPRWCHPGDLPPFVRSAPEHWRQRPMPSWFDRASGDLGPAEAAMLAEAPQVLENEWGEPIVVFGMTITRQRRKRRRASKGEAASAKREPAGPKAKPAPKADAIPRPQTRKERRAAMFAELMAGAGRARRRQTMQ